MSPIKPYVAVMFPESVTFNVPFMRLDNPEVDHQQYPRLTFTYSGDVKEKLWLEPSSHQRALVGSG